jgi:structural maintenance of chromosome 4
LEKDFKAPERTQRLFDLVKSHEQRFLPAFYFSLTNTLVCKDLNTAHGVAYSGPVRYRVVTFTGELIEPNGTLSGGGKPSSGKM